MDLNKMHTSTDLAFVNPQAHDQKFVVSKNVKDLDTLRKTFKPQKPSVLGKVRDFLPKLAAANEDVQKQLEINPLSVSVENVEEGETHVEMNIALMEQYSESDSTDTSDSEDDVPIGEITEDNLRLPKHKCAGKVLIECCTDSKENEIPNNDQDYKDMAIETETEKT